MKKISGWIEMLCYAAISTTMFFTLPDEWSTRETVGYIVIMMLSVMLAIINYYNGMRRGSEITKEVWGLMK